MKSDEQVYNELATAIQGCFFADYDKAKTDDEKMAIMRSQVRALFLHAMQSMWLCNLPPHAIHEMVDAVYSDLAAMPQPTDGLVQ